MKIIHRSKLLIILIMILLFISLLSPSALAAASPALSQKSIQLLVGKSYDLNVKNIKKTASCQWSSSNTKIASVNKEGVVKGVSKGTALITCTLKYLGKNYKLTATADIIAAAKKLTIQKNAEVIKIGDLIDLDYTLSPSSSNDIVSWKSSDEAVAKPDAEGKFTAQKAGVATITANAFGGAMASVKITVVDDSTLQITSKDIVDGKLTLTDQNLQNVFISNSVGNAAITFDQVTIAGTLSMESGAAYTVNARFSTISCASFVAPASLSEAISGEEKPILQISDESVINSALLMSSASLEQSANGKLKSLKISPTLKGNYEMFITGYQGDMSLNYEAYSNCYIKLAGCKIGTLNINKASGENLFLLSDRDNPSTVNKLNLMASIFTLLDIDTNTVEVSSEISEADFYFVSQIQTLINHGAIISITMGEDGYIYTLQDNQSKKGSYGIYDFVDDRGKWASAFSLTIDDKRMEGIQTKDFDKLFKDWTDKSKPLVDPITNTTVTYLEEDKYLFEFSGTKVTMDINLERGVVTVYCNEDITLSDICVAKDKK